MDWRIFKRRLDELMREGIAKQISPPDGIDGRSCEWYLDVATGDVYRYGPPALSLEEWMGVDPHKIDSEKLARWERVPRP